MRRLPLLLALVALPLAGCGGDASSDDIEDTGESGVFGQLQNMERAVEEMQAAAEREPADPVNFRELRETLPEALSGMERTEAEGATQTTMGFSISEAEATYEVPEGNGRIDISVMDYGAVPALGMMGFAWTMTEIDRETSSGYEKTIRMGENKGFRKYDTEGQRGEFSLVIADRFIVQVDGRDVSDDQIEAALRAVDLDALEGMRDAGRP